MIYRDNYHKVKAHLSYRDEVKQHDPKTVKRVGLRLKHLLIWADDQPIALAPEIRPVFPQYLMQVDRGDTGTALSAEGMKRICCDARAFFIWLRQEYPGEFPRITTKWIDTIRPPRMAAEPPKTQELVNLEMVRQLIAVEAPPHDLATQRDKATAALLFLSGMRAGAMSTLPIACLNLDERSVLQYPTMGVHTKNKKAAKTSLLAIADLMAEVRSWDRMVRQKLPETAPWYSVIKINMGSQILTANRPGKYRMITLAKNIKKLFVKAGLSPMSPHKFRRGHANYGILHGKDIGDAKAISQNLMHSSMAVTDSTYAVLSNDEVRERLSGLGADINVAIKTSSGDPPDAVEALFKDFIEWQQAR